jgi:hypothetical protein
MKTFIEYLEEARDRGNKINTGPGKKDFSNDGTAKHKVGDSVWVIQPNNYEYKSGKIHRVGRTMYHVKHHDGSISAYAPEHVTDSDMSDQNPYAKSDKK